MKKENKMLKAIQQQPSARNLSSNIVRASGPITPSQVVSSKYQSEPPRVAAGATEFDQISDQLADFLEEDDIKNKTPIGKISKEADEAYKKVSDYKTPEQIENIKKVEETKRLKEQVAKQRLEKEAILAEKKAMEAKRAAQRLEESKAFAKGNILKKGGKFGILASALGLGTSLLAPESKAAEIVSKIGEAAEKADPATYLQQGISDFDKKFQQMQDEAKRKKLEKQIMEREVGEVVKTTGGEPDIRPSKAESMIGEKESKDIEDMSNILDYEDYLKQRKRKFGYE